MLGTITGTQGILITRELSGKTGSGIFPVGYTESWFPPGLCSALLRINEADLKRYSFYHILEKECNTPMISAEESISVCCSERSPADTPCLEIIMHVYTYDATPLEYRRSVLDASHWQLIRTHELRETLYPKPYGEES